jgi:hypothetical protein
VEKTSGQKSRATVPLILNMYIHVHIDDNEFTYSEDLRIFLYLTGKIEEENLLRLSSTT